MNLLDSSGWIEYFADGPNAGRFAPAVADTAALLVPTIVLHEVFRWADREGGELAANRAVVAMPDLSIFPKNSPIFWTISLWRRVVTYLNHEPLTHWGLRPETG